MGRWYHARWWHRAGFWTSGTFCLDSAEEVREQIEADGGTEIEVTML